MHVRDVTAHGRYHVVANPQNRTPHRRDRAWIFDYFVPNDSLADTIDTLRNFYATIKFKTFFNFQLTI